MFTGAQIVTTKLVHPNKQNELIDAQNEDRVAQDLVNMSILVPRSKAAIVVETEAEKLERKAFAQERKHERMVEQQKIARRMEDLMEKVLRETPLSKKEEENLRRKIKTIVDKVNKESDQIDVTSLHSSSGIQSNSIEPLNSLKPTNQGPFLLWYDKNFH